MKLIIAVLCVSLLAAPAHAQSLRTATQVYAATTVADWTMTGIGLSRGFGELNPALRWTQNDPAKTVIAGAVADAVGVWAMHRFVGRRHPTAAARTLVVLSAVRVFWVARWVQVLPAGPDAMR